MTIDAQYQTLKQALETIYDADESAAMATLVLEHFTGIDRNDIHSHKQDVLSGPVKEAIQQALQALLQHEPLQYVLQQAWFYGRPFFVNRHVLIPRPETEELVYEALQWLQQRNTSNDTVNILDIGTGSGCIPITLKKEFGQANIYTVDISKEALEVAAQNAATLDADIDFMEGDFLEETTWDQYQQYDLIISNPPYIPLSEKELMDKHVADWEPATALFVPNDDALLFYRKIGGFAKDHLKKGGKIFFECHYVYAKQTAALLEEMGFDVLLKKDMHGNDRMLIVFRDV
jgi:release factor glutamine methyltransferase